MHWGDHMNWGWGGGIMMILWIILLAAAVYLVVRMARRNGSGPGGQESALDVLKKRYARGDITREEYEERKKDLQ